jgi:hypothetical protein
MTDATNAPQVAQSAQRIARIRSRAAEDVRGRTEERLRELVLEWAGRDDGPPPTRADAEEQVRAELEVLCRGLGRWAAVAPEELFPPDRWW